MSSHVQFSVTIAATAVVGGMASAAADLSASAKTADTVHLEGPDTKAPSLMYRTASHDTLETAAKRARVSPTAIARTNELIGPLRTGQRLKIPSISRAPKVPLPAESSDSLSHTVRQGDTLNGITRQHGTTVAAIAQANGIADPTCIYTGKMLTTPGAAMEALATPQSLVPKTFLHYTYPDSTNSIVNVNKLVLEGAAVPSHAQIQKIVRSTAAQMGADPKFALTHAYVESDFDTRSVSPTNAIGAMQVTPSSGEWASRLVGRRLNLLDSYDSAVAGITIIHYLQSNADSADQGIAGYYQGLGGARKNGMRPDTAIYVSRIKAARACF